MIAGTFPGLFSFRDLLNLDIRDFEFWFRAARRMVLNDKIDALRMSRMAWAESADVNDEFDRLIHEFEGLDGPKKKRYAKTWAEAIGKRKG